MPKVRDDDIHDWVVIADESMRKCKNCGRYQWWFLCYQEWRYDIPWLTFTDLKRKFKDEEFNHRDKYLYVSFAEIDAWGHPHYHKMDPQPEGAWNGR